MSPNSSTLLTPPATPRRGPQPLPFVDDAVPEVATLPVGNALGLFIPDHTLPNGGAPLLGYAPAWTHASRYRRLRRVRRRLAPPPPLNAAQQVPAAYAPPIAAPTAGPSGGIGQNAQLSINGMPHQVADAATGGAGST